ncbi:hypothetical protein GCM10009718_17460 [Isoptericola halotolerans]|uniref:HPt (Histidine-containing phosphotransfer) domain-containing protein n=1 Tax=Isoptericola halotolerans TaxID=300560 RepID=A0ABX2A726_9MICO|nr:Hpt domain-containing protein [Isoptericola halotolerans]NOV98665.1 HPt (histidine-containing phosphotransfer) domain-containing protein [Isoptericola halotolerans]
MSAGPPGSGAGGDAMDDAVARLAAAARRRNLERADRVLDLVPPGEDLFDVAARDEAVLLCHSIAGSAGTFGDGELAEAARDLESLLRDGRSARRVPALGRLRATVQDLRRR